MRTLRQALIVSSTFFTLMASCSDDAGAPADATIVDGSTANGSTADGSTADGSATDGSRSDSTADTATADAAATDAAATDAAANLGANAECDPAHDKCGTGLLCCATCCGVAMPEDGGGFDPNYRCIAEISGSSGCPPIP